MLSKRITGVAEEKSDEEVVDECCVIRVAKELEHFGSVVDLQSILIVQVASLKAAALYLQTSAML